MQLKTLAKELWCTYCRLPLSLEGVTDELKKGYASIFSVKCFQCNNIRQVHTDSYFSDQANDNSLSFCVNIKASAGKIF